MFLFPPAFWIAHRALKIYIDDDEGLVSTDFDTQAVKTAFFNRFSMRSNVDLLELLYHFNKQTFSAITKDLADRKLAHSSSFLRLGYTRLLSTQSENCRNTNWNQLTDS